MVAALLDAGGFDPTVINGGIINAYGTNARLGAGEWMVVEADESDGTFLRCRPTVAIVTNVDPEHLDYYGTFDACATPSSAFVENVPFYGFAVLCTRSSGSAGDGRPHRGSPHRHLWFQSAGRCARANLNVAFRRRIAFRS
jgi:UDP-N-acetylmuramate-alanine ligase